MYELAHRQDVQTTLRNELLQFEGLHGRAPEYADIVSAEKAGLVYLSAVTNEILRTKAALMVIAREVRLAVLVRESLPS